MYSILSFQDLMICIYWLDLLERLIGLRYASLAGTDGMSGRQDGWGSIWYRLDRRG